MSFVMTFGWPGFRPAPGGRGWPFWNLCTGWGLAVALCISFLTLTQTSATHARCFSRIYRFQICQDSALEAASAGRPEPVEAYRLDWPTEPLPQGGLGIRLKRPMVPISPPDGQGQREIK